METTRISGPLYNLWTDLPAEKTLATAFSEPVMYVNTYW